MMRRPPRSTRPVTPFPYPTLFRSVHRVRKPRISAAISAAWVSSAKCPVSKKRTTAAGMSRLKASAPAGRKKGSFLPQTARKGDRKSVVSGKSVYVRVDLGGRRIIKKKNNNKSRHHRPTRQTQTTQTQ